MTKLSKNPYGICHKKVKDNKSFLFCYRCNFRVHIKCNNISLAVYTTISNRPNDAPWFCIKVTLLSAPVSSELPFCKTTLLRKQLISPILFGRSKIGKTDVVLHGLGNRKICKSQWFR